MSMFEYKRRNRKVFRRCMKTESDGADVMSDDSSFYRLAPKTRNARLPTVVRQKDSTVRQLEEADLSLC